LRYFNFGIIVFVFIKYGKTPLMDFLQGRKEKLAQEIKQLENKKGDLAAKIKENQATIDESEVRFAELKERIVKQGERKKQEIVESAQQQSRMMIDDAKRRIKSYFFQAKDAFKAEMIDAAIDLAMQRLPKEITAEDNEKFTNQYLASTLAE
jgi:F-type H+-transporting ATPase subunit b